MVTVSIKDEYIEVLSALGYLQESMNLSLKQYFYFSSLCVLCASVVRLFI